MNDFLTNVLCRVYIDSALQGMVALFGGRFIFVNRRASEITGYSSEELLGFSAAEVADLVYKDDLPNFMYYAGRYYKGINIESKLEYRFRHKNGTYKWIECQTKSIEHDGKVYLVQLILDIAEKKTAEERTFNSEEKYKNFIEQSNEGIYLLEFKEPVNIDLPTEDKIRLFYEHGYITECNNSLARMYGLKSAEDMKGKRLIEIHGGSENEINRSAFRDFIESGYKTLDIETEEVKQNGDKVCFVNDVTGIITNGFLNGIWGSQKDITEIKKSENRKNAAYRISEAVHNVKDLDELFISIHEIVGSFMPADNFYIALYDRKSDVINFPYFVDEFDTKINQKKPSKGATEYILKTGKPLLAHPYKFKELEKSGEVELIGKYSEDWLGVPLISEEYTFGVIVVQSYTEGIGFTEDDMDMLVFVADQTTLAIERKKSEEKIKSSEEKYRNFVEQSLEGVYFIEYYEPVNISDPVDIQIKNILDNAYISDCNDLFAKMYGFKLKNELIGKKLAELYEIFGKKDNYDSIIQFIENDYKILNKETTEKDIYGNEVYFLNNFAGIRKDGHLISLWGTQIDITVQKKALKKNEFMSRLLLAVSKSEEILLIEQDVNKALGTAIEIIGKAAAADRVNIYENCYDEKTKKQIVVRKYDWCSNGSFDLTDNKTGDIFVPYGIFGKLLSELSSGKVISGIYTDFPPKEKNVFISHGIKSILVLPVNAGGYFWGYIGIENCSECKVWDESEKTILKTLANSIGGLISREKAETSLRFSESKNKALLSALPDIMFVQTRDGVYLDYHARDEKMLFLPPEQFLGKNLNEVLPEKIAKDVTLLCEKVFTEGKQQFYEYNINLPGGNYFYEARMVAHDDNKILSIVRDITSRVKLYAELKSAKEKAEEMYRIKTNFLANMSHELRTPLHGILGFAQVLMEEIDHKEYKDMSEIIYKSGNRLLETLNMLLNFSKIEAEKITANYSIFNVNEVIQEVSKLFEPLAKSKGLFLNNNFRNSFVYARLDERLLREVLINLVNNAIKFTEKGGITLIIDIIEDNLIISVLDTGIGIPEEKHGLIFEEFRQESEGISRNFEGTGLGLTLTKKFIDLMNGTIQVESTPAEGSTFIVTLPVGFLSGNKISSETEKTGVPESAKIIKTGSDKTNEKKLLSVLLVENDFVCIQLVKTYLRNLYYLDYAKDGESAVNLAKEKHFDVILMDINLGLGMTGIEVTKIIRAIPGYEKIPVIAVTAFAMTKDKEEFLNAGCSFYIAKPYEKSDLLGILDKALCRQRMKNINTPAVIAGVQ